MFYYVLTLWCLTCSPIQVYQLHDIPAYTSSSTVWANIYCRHIGDILSGDWDRRNIDILKPKRQAAAMQDRVVYSCTLESAEF